METLEKIGKGAVATGLVAVVGGVFTLFVGSFGGVWGSRGIDDVYKFQYQGKPAMVQRDNRIWAADSYWIIINEGDKITSGILTSDDGKEVGVGSTMLPYAVREKKE